VPWALLLPVHLHFLTFSAPTASLRNFVAEKYLRKVLLDALSQQALHGGNQLLAGCLDFLVVI
jgi:hypothetical protein